MAKSLSREDRDFLNEHLTEAEVFVKYGLLEKAIGPLLTVLERFPEHLETAREQRPLGAGGERQRVVAVVVREVVDAGSDRR